MKHMRNTKLQLYLPVNVEDIHHAYLKAIKAPF